MSPAERLPPLFAAKSTSPSEPDARADEVEADAEPLFATLPDISERDLQADTLAFERVGRRRPSAWGWLKLGIALIVIGGAGAGAWRIWGEDLFRPTGDEVPVVRAAEGPIKVRPETPGGAEIRDRDKQVYELMEPVKKGQEQPPVEILRPKPEAPLPPPVAAPAMTPESAPAAGAEGSPQLVEEAGPESDEEETAMAPVESAPASEPASESAPAPAPGSPPPERVAAVERPAPPPPPPPVKSEPVAAAPQAPAAPSRAFKIQLGAVRSEAAARSEWTRLQKLHQPVLGKLTLNVERADLGPKGVFYRIQAGPFADRAAADAACQTLTKQKVPCLPVRPDS